MDFFTTSYTIGAGNFSFSLTPLDFVLRFIIPVLGMFILYKILMALSRKLLSKSDDEKGIADRVGKWVKFLLRTALTLGFLGALGSLLGISGYTYIRDFLNFLQSPFFTTGNTSISVVTVLLVIPIFYLASWAGKSVQYLLEKSILPELTALDEGRKVSIANISRFLTLVFVLLFMLSVIGIDLSALGVLIGALGIGVGFGLQDMVANFFAGIAILFARQIKINDRVQINDYEGTVTDIKLMSTTVTTLENENIIIPNSKIIYQVMHNYSYHDRQILLVNRVGVHYKTDLEKALDVLREMASENPWGVKNAEPVALIRSFDDSGITLELRTHLRDVANRPQAFAWTNLHIWKSFKESGIEMPYPQLDVHFQNRITPEKEAEASKSSFEE